MRVFASNENDREESSRERYETRRKSRRESCRVNFPPEEKEEEAGGKHLEHICPNVWPSVKLEANSTGKRKRRGKGFRLERKGEGRGNEFGDKWTEILAPVNNNTTGTTATSLLPSRFIRAGCKTSSPKRLLQDRSEKVGRRIGRRGEVPRRKRGRVGGESSGGDRCKWCRGSHSSVALKHEARRGEARTMRDA